MEVLIEVWVLWSVLILHLWSMKYALIATETGKGKKMFSSAVPRFLAELSEAVINKKRKKSAEIMQIT